MVSRRVRGYERNVRHACTQREYVRVGWPGYVPRMMTIDHLAVDHRVTVLRAFTDARGVAMDANDGGVIRHISFDQMRLEIHVEIERDAGERVRLTFPLKATSGPRNGHMREFFDVGDYVAVPGEAPVRHDAAERKTIVPKETPEPAGRSARWRSAQDIEGSDTQDEMEQRLLNEIPHIGAAASIAEMYAQRMRAFRAEGNEARAIAAFTLAIQWMGTYAGWATSGGEGAALSYERDTFHAALVKEFGYDPTAGLP